MTAVTADAVTAVLFLGVTMASPAIIDFSTATATDEASRPSPERLLSGDPVQTVRNLFSDPSGQFFAGTWSSSPGRWRVSYTENEFCHLLDGVIRITDEQGIEKDFAAGSSFVVPAGFSGIWEVIEPARKLYAIFESR
jgi:uncharacterized protein